MYRKKQDVRTWKLVTLPQDSTKRQQPKKKWHGKGKSEFDQTH